MKKTVALVSLVVAGLLVAIVGVPWMRAGAKVSPKLRGEQIKQEKEEAEYKAQLPNATPVKPGILSERQRIHSKLYSSYKAERGDKTISGLVEQAKLKGAKLAGTTAFVGSTTRLPNPVRETPDSFFTALARKSEMVVRGVPVSKSSQITEDDGYIFTDYEIVVKEVFKNNVASPTAAGETIIVTRPGGKVLLDGIIVTAEDQSFAPLPLDGQEVLLFLQFISDSGGYKATNNQGSFEVDGLTVRPLTESQFPPNVLDRNLEQFVQTVRTAAAN